MSYSPSLAGDLPDGYSVAREVLDWRDSGAPIYGRGWTVSDAFGEDPTGEVYPTRAVATGAARALYAAELCEVYADAAEVRA